MVTTFDRMRERYRGGDVPWDEPDPPPEVVELAASLPAGRVLDVGCGFGRAAIHLARRGWTVDAVDFVPEALSVAGQRAGRAGVADRIRFMQSEVPDLSQLTDAYDLILDVGCGHSLEADLLAAYVDELARLAQPGGTVAWFLRLREPDTDDGGAPVPSTGRPAESEGRREEHGGSEADSPSGPRGIAEVELRRLLADHFTIEAVEYGRSGASDGPKWPSAWFWLRRRED